MEDLPRNSILQRNIFTKDSDPVVLITALQARKKNSSSQQCKESTHCGNIPMRGNWKHGNLTQHHIHLSILIDDIFFAGTSDR